jgi:predicted hydrocarbon binding protein
VTGGRAAPGAAPPGDDPRARLEALLAALGRMGWGEFTLERLTPTELTIVTRASPVARAYGRAPAGVCHLTRGALETLAHRALGRSARVRETACLAAGADACRFEALLT